MTRIVRNLKTLPRFLMASMGLLLSTTILSGFGAAPSNSPDGPGAVEGCPGIPCSCSCGDPFDPRERFKEGPFKGRCIPTCKARTLKVLSEDEAKGLGYRSDSVGVANIRHLGDYYLGEIPVNEVKDVYVQTQPFEIAPPFTVHIQLRFDFEREFELRPQDPGSGAKPVLTHSLVFSGFPVGYAEEPLTGLLSPMNYTEVTQAFGKSTSKHYVMTYELITLEDIFKMTVDDEIETGQIRLALSPSEKQSVVKTALDYAQEKELRTPYHALFNTCFTMNLDVLDRAIRYTGLSRMAPLDPLGRMLPHEVDESLRIRRLLYPRGGSRVPDLYEELRDVYPQHVTRGYKPKFRMGWYFNP